MLIEAKTSAGARATASVAMADGGSVGLHWGLPHSPGRGWVDALLPAALPVAMRLGEPLRFSCAVSARMLRAAVTIQDLYASWGAQLGLEYGEPPLFRRVPLEVEAAAAGGTRGDGVACFFTAGVDSFYSVLKHRAELTALVYVYGFDVQLRDAALREKVGEGIRMAAASLGLPLVEIESDIRAFSDPLVSWPNYHGAALASVALILADRFRRVYVPATMTYGTLLPLGSHPMLDPLWSSERVEIVHDGAEATRQEKLVAIAECGAARRWLRVCWENRGGAYNCGRCEKCLRTQVELRLANVAQRFDSFPDLDLHDVANAPLEFGAMGWHAALRSAERDGRDPRLAEALRSALLRQHLIPFARGEPWQFSYSGQERLDLLALATATADERDRLQARVVKLERLAALEERLARLRDTRVWCAATRAWRARNRLKRRLGRGG